MIARAQLQRDGERSLCKLSMRGLSAIPNFGSDLQGHEVFVMLLLGNHALAVQGDESLRAVCQRQAMQTPHCRPLCG